MKKLFLLLPLAAVIITGCKTHDNDMNNTSGMSSNMNSMNSNTDTNASYSGGMPSVNGAPATTH